MTVFSGGWGCVEQSTYLSGISFLLYLLLILEIHLNVVQQDSVPQEINEEQTLIIHVLKQ